MVKVVFEHDGTPLFQNLCAVYPLFTRSKKNISIKILFMFSYLSLIPMYKNWNVFTFFKIVLVYSLYTSDSKILIVIFAKNINCLWKYVQTKSYPLYVIHSNNIIQKNAHISYFVYILFLSVLTISDFILSAHTR